MNVGSVYYLKIKVLYFRKNTFDSLKRYMYRLKSSANIPVSE